MDWCSRQQAQPGTQHSGPYVQSGQNDGLCYVCGNYSDRLRRVCIHNNQDMLICWVCELCDVQPSSATIYRTKG